MWVKTADMKLLLPLSSSGMYVRRNPLAMKEEDFSELVSAFGWPGINYQSTEVHWKGRYVFFGGFIGWHSGGWNLASTKQETLE